MSGLNPRLFRSLRAIAVCALGGVTASAATVSVPYHDAGFFGADGRNSKEDAEALGLPTTVPTFANYHVGLSDGYSAPPFPDNEVRNFFVFDWDDALASFGGMPPGPITSATLKLYNPGSAANGADGYLSPHPSETYFLSGIGAMTPDAVMAHYDHPFYGGPDESGGAMMVFDSLAAGPEFGSAVVSAVDNGTYVSIVLTPTGIGYLNGHLGGFFGSGGLMDKFAFGGKLITIGGMMGDPVLDPYEEVFAFTHPNGLGAPDTSATPPFLELTFLPEPASAALLALGAVFGHRRRGIAPG